MIYNETMGDEGKNTVTIQTVADLAGVSIKTVSRVLNEELSVREKTRSKVKQAIEDLQYQPSPAAQALAGNQSKIIGLIYGNIAASYILRLQNGALKACYANGFSLVIHPCDHTSDDLAGELIELAKNSRLDGLILIPPICDDFHLINTLLENDVPFVRLAPAQEAENICSISSNDAEAVEKIILHLIQQGHKNIGFIKGHAYHGATQRRLLGYKNALQKSGLSIDPGLIFDGDFSFESGKVSGRKLLERKHPPSAIFACNDYMAAGVLYVANEMNIKVPDELSVLGFDNAPVSRQISPMISTIKQPIEDMAEAAAQLLIDIGKGHDIQNEHLVFNAELLLRESHKAIVN